MGYSGETNDINFSSGTTAFYGFLGFLINGESTNGAGLSESNIQMPFSSGTISLLWCRVITAATSSSTVTLRKNGANADNTISINANTTGAKLQLLSYLWYFQEVQLSLYHVHF